MTGPPCLGVGLVGFGMAGRVFHGPLVSATEGMEVRGISTSNGERQLDASSRYPDAQVVSTFEELLALENLDLLVIGTPHDSHCELTIRGLETGFHVVTDKIMALSVDEGERMIRASEKAGKILSVFHNRRWDSDFLTVQKAIQDGFVGEPFIIENCVLRPPPPPEAVKAGTDFKWRMRRDKGGGPFMDWGAHLMDQAVILGGGLPETVYCELEHRWEGPDVESQALCRLAFKNGLKVHVEVGSFAHHERFRWHVRGRHGALEIRGLDPQEEALKQNQVISGGPKAALRQDQLSYKGQKDLYPDIIPGQYGAFYANIRDAIVHRKPVAVTPQSCVKVLRVYEAAFKSDQEKQVVSLNS